MSTVNFYLKSPDKKGKSLVIMTYQNKGEKFRFCTKLKIEPKSWKEQRVKPGFYGYAEINSLLDGYEQLIREIEREAIFNKKVYAIHIIKNKFDLKVGHTTGENNFLKIYDRFIEENKATKSQATIQTYESTKKKLTEFSNEKKVPLNFEGIDQNFYEAFLNYMLRDLKFLNNTVGKHIKTLKVFLNYAIDHEFTNQNYNFKKFKVFREDADVIYLTEEELMKIYYADNLLPRLVPIKDIFCFCCFTGLRFSDAAKLKNFNISNEYVEVKTEKTKDSIKVPLNHYALEILKKYEGQYSDKPLPTGLTNQKTNEYLKEIAQFAEISETISVEKFSGSKKITIVKPKHEFISTHTARRTFVTLSLEKGIRAEVVMAMAGHKNYKTFKKYIQITDKVMSIEMNRVWAKSLMKAV